MVFQPRERETDGNERRPARRAIYGTSARLGGVEFLAARFGDSHRFAPHIHPVFAIGAVREGACRIWHRGVSHLARVGDLIVINPGDPHSAEPAATGGWDYGAIYFNGAAAVALRAIAPAASDHARLGGVVRRDPELAERLGVLCRCLEDDPEGLAGEAMFAHFVRALFARFGDSRDASAKSGASDEHAIAREYIESNFDKPLHLGELAELTGQSTFRLIRGFSRCYGMPPYTYLTHVRVAHARQLLRDGHPITDTAMAVGFCDQSHLTRVFRRITGVPPGVYAKALHLTAARRDFSATPRAS